MGRRQYSDEQLVAAVQRARSWRGVLRELGLRGTSAGSLRSVRAQAERLGIDHAHFTGQRRWADVELATAIEGAANWTGVAEGIGLTANGTTLNALRAHARRLNLDTGHLEHPRPPRGEPLRATVRSECLREAGSLYAATWFALRGARISWPLEPCRYDLLVEIDGALLRVQVKTTQGAGPSATASLSNSRRSGRRVVYAPEEVDLFFVIDAGLKAYLIPYEAVAGLEQIRLERYARFGVSLLDTPID